MSFSKTALEVIDIEAQAITKLRGRINSSFDQACQAILAAKGRVVVLGIGKSGHIGNKIAATLASTGTPAFAVNAGEASHGDFGMITANDVVIAISNSGKTSEIINLLPLLKQMKVTLISLCGRAHSDLVRQSDISLDVSIEEEACPLGLAPTASTTATLVMGDALAIALLQARGFTKEQFAFTHPGGALGKRLLLHARDVMVTGDAVPKVGPQTSWGDALVEISNKHLGMTTVVDAKGQLLGIYTDGDIRRCVEAGVDTKKTMISAVMTEKPLTISPDQPALECLRLMEKHTITSLVVVGADNSVEGVVHIHNLFNAGVS